MKSTTPLLSSQFDLSVLMSIVETPKGFSTAWLLPGDLCASDVADLRLPPEIVKKIRAHINQVAEQCKFAIRVLNPRKDAVPEDPMEKFIWDLSRSAISDFGKKRRVIHLVAFRNGKVV